jgi:hypothetical protein
MHRRAKPAVADQGDTYRFVPVCGAWLQGRSCRVREFGSSATGHLRHALAQTLHAASIAVITSGVYTFATMSEEYHELIIRHSISSSLAFHPLGM